MSFGVALLVEPSLFGATRVWTAACDGQKWSSACNWSPQGAPVSGETLTFGVTYPIFGFVQAENDLPAGFVAAGLGMKSFQLSGNPFVLDGDLSVAAQTDAQSSYIDTAVTLGRSVQASGRGTVGVRLLSFNGQTLTVRSGLYVGLSSPSGPGAIVVEEGAALGIGSQPADFSGTVSGAAVAVSGDVPSAVLDVSSLSGEGLLKSITLRAGGSLSPGNVQCITFCQSFPGVFGTTDLTIRGTYDADVASRTSDRIVASGRVTLDGATLVLHVLPDGPLASTPLMIIDNAGSSPVNGIFSGYPEGAVVTAANGQLRITYHGGDGNDVVLSATSAGTTTVLSQSAPQSGFGSAFTLTAKVTASSPPAGTVTFLADGAPIGSAAVQNGVATIESGSLEIGEHVLTARFTGSGFAESTSDPIVHRVVRAYSQVRLASSRPTSFYGQPVDLNVEVTPATPVPTQVGGRVFLRAGTLSLEPPALTLANGVASLTTATLPLGSYPVSAQYEGDAHFDTSVASITQTVMRAPTAVDVRLQTPLLNGAAPTLTVFVDGPQGSVIQPAGSLSVEEAGQLLGTATLANGRAILSLPPLSAGEHALVVSYAGTPEFEPSSATVTQVIELPAISIGSARVIEGDEGSSTVTLPITLSAPVSLPVRVSFVTVAGSATEGADYQPAAGVVEFAPGEQTRSIELQVLGDTLVEPDESFSVVLSDAVGATLGSRTAVVVIVNDDSASARRRAARH